MTDLAYLKLGSNHAYGQLLEDVNLPVGQMESITFRQHVCSLIDRDHILHLKHDDHIKTLTHSLQKYKTDVDCDDTLKKNDSVLIYILCNSITNIVQDSPMYPSMHCSMNKQCS